MNRYESYKDSGIPWLGEVPAHWEVKRLKFLAKIQNGADYKHVETNEGYPVIGSGGQFAYACDYLYKGKSVLLGRKGTIDKPLYVDDAFWTVDTMYYTEIFKNTYPKFFYYLVLTVDFKKYSTQTALPSMTQTVLNNLIFAVPAYKEQTAIADYLDNKLGEIDALISKQETLLEKLAEQRTTIITHAVTKGLNAHAPMKNSGVAWLGDVPEHWEIKAIKRVVKEHSGNGFPIELQGNNGEIPFLKVSDLNKKGKFLNDFTNTVDEDLAIMMKWNILPKFSLVTAKIGEALRKNHRKIICNSSIIDNNCIGFECINIDVNYHYYLSLIIDFDWFENGGTVPSLSVQKYKNQKICIPPLPEQTAIANYLDEQTAKIDRLSDTVNQTIARLKEYRSALITQAVTGKIKVV